MKELVGVAVEVAYSYFGDAGFTFQPDYWLFLQVFKPIFFFLVC
jgi:hypothetical protein